MIKMINKILDNYGFEIIKLKKEEPNILKMLKNHKIDLILDIGANIGQYAENLFDVGYEGRIVSFEPISSVYNELLEKSKKNLKWEVAERSAIGEKDGEIKINIARNPVNSSILPMSKKFNQIANALHIDSERVKMYKLDTIAPKYIKKKDQVFLKLDVQGYEDRVLKGATKLLSRIKGLQLESSITPFYEGEILFDRMIKKIMNKGFEVNDILNVFRDQKTGRLLQVDFIFFRE